MRLSGIRWIAEFNVEHSGTELRELNYADLDGQRVARTAGQIYADRDLRAIYGLSVMSVISGSGPDDLDAIRKIWLTGFDPKRRARA